MDFIDDFIKEYKSNPCLWKADCADFKNRSKRQEAYVKLIDVASKHGEHYNVERTKQKINNLRCAFRHQLKKYNELKKKGEKYEPYCPKRRYFESLMFLKDEEIPDKRIKRETTKQTKQISNESRVNCIQIENYEEFSDPEGINKKHTEPDKSSVNSNEFCENIFEETVQSSEPIISIPKSGVSIKEVEVIISPESLHETTHEMNCGNISNNMIESTNVSKEHTEPQIIEFEKDNLIRQNQNQSSSRKRSSSVSSRISNEIESNPSRPLKADISTIDFERLLSLAFKSVGSGIEDHFTNFGKIIAHKLRSMDPTQAIYAEKIIGDVLYQGQMKMLSTLSISQFLSNDHSNAYVENHNK